MRNREIRIRRMDGWLEQREGTDEEKQPNDGMEQIVALCRFYESWGGGGSSSTPPPQTSRSPLKLKAVQLRFRK